MTYAFPVNSDVIDYDDNGRPIGDRVFNADDLAEVVETFFSNGVIMREDSFQVAPSDGMSVIVGKGRCIIEGRGKSFPEPKTMVLQAADPTYDRMDTIVLRWNSARAVRDIDLFVKSGTPQLAPVAPTLTRNDQVYELGICNILVPKNSTSVSASRITDTRLDDSRCGVVSALIDVDTTSFFEQLEAATNEAVELSQEALEGTLAGDLQGQITQNRDDIDAIKANGWVTTDRIGSKQVTSAKLADKSVTESALSDSVNPKNLIKTVEVKTSFTVPANGFTYVQAQFEVPSGYTPIAVPYVDGGDQGFTITGILLDSGTIGIGFRSIKSSATTKSNFLVAKVTCIKSI